MNDLTRRISSLPPEKLALLERRLKLRPDAAGAAVPPAAAPSPVGGNGSLSHVEGAQELAAWPSEQRQIEETLEQHPGLQKSKVVFGADNSGKTHKVAYLVPDDDSAGPVRRLLRMESELPAPGRPLYEMPNGMAVFHLNRSETEYVYREIFEEQSYLRHGIRLPADACVFDVGAHIGLFTLFVSQLSPGATVYAFEPLPPTFDALRLNASLYGVNAKLFDFGLSDREGHATFSYYAHASVLSGCYADAEVERETIRASLNAQRQLGVKGMSLSEAEIEDLLQAMLTVETFTRPVKTLSQVIRENGVERIDLLKVDVEKSERDVLAGIDEEGWPKIRQVVVEVHDVGGRVEELTRLLEGRGFRLTVEQDAILRETSLYNIYGVRPSADETAPASTGGRAALAPRWKWSSPERLLGDVRQFALEKLPAHLRPDEFVLLNALPLTPGGEVKHPPRVSHNGRRPGAAGAPGHSRPTAEEELTKLWAEALGLERVSGSENFFSLGGDWLRATELLARVRQTFDVELSPRDLYEAPTPAELARVVAARAPGQEARAAQESSSRSSREGRHLPKLTASRKRTWTPS